jgi:hypothetical protein
MHREIGSEEIPDVHSELYTGDGNARRDGRRCADMRKVIGDERRMQLEVVLHTAAHARPRLMPRGGTIRAAPPESPKRRRSAVPLPGGYVEIEVCRAPDERVAVQPEA